MEIKSSSDTRRAGGHGGWETYDKIIILLKPPRADDDRVVQIELTGRPLVYLRT